MSKTNKSQETRSNEPQTLATAVVSQVTQPSTYEQYVDETPTATKSLVIAKRSSYGQESKDEILTSYPIFGTYHLNMPLKEGALYVPSMYKLIETMAYTYDRQYIDSFFLQYPQLLEKVLTSKEIVDHQYDRDWLRGNKKMLSKRVAHVFWEYDQAVTAMVCSLQNLLTAIRYNGDEPWKTIATNCRINYINASSSNYKGFPKPKGVEALVNTSARFLRGKSYDDAEILIMPLYDTDIVGNRGSDAITLDSLSTSNFTENAVAGGSLIKENKDGSDEGVDPRIIELLRNMSRALAEYEYPVRNHLLSNVTSKVPKWATGVDENYCKPGHFKIENSSVLTEVSVLDSGTVKTLSQPLGITDDIGKMTDNSSYDNIVTNIWQSWCYWYNHVQTFFPEFYDPQSDWVKIGNQLGLYDKESKSVIELQKATQTYEGYNLNDFLDEMKFKKGNHVTTATTVRMVPTLVPFAVDLEMASSDFEKSDLNTDEVRDWMVKMNFERYDIDGAKSVGEYLSKSKVWPRNTPTMFDRIKPSQSIDNNSDLPIILNAAPSVGCDQSNPTGVSHVCSPVGKFSAMMDFAQSNVLTPEYSQIELMGIDTKEGQDWVDKFDGLIFEEDPSSIFCPVVPILDNTDPFQCGVNLMISDEAAFMNVWDKYFMDTKKYTVNVAPIDVAIANPYLVPSTPFYKVAKSSESAMTDYYYSHAHVSNKQYLKAVKHALIFLGDMIGENPMLITSDVGCGNPLFDLTMDTEKLEFIQAIKTAPDPISRISPGVSHWAGSGTLGQLAGQVALDSILTKCMTNVVGVGDNGVVAGWADNSEEIVQGSYASALFMGITENPKADPKKFRLLQWLFSPAYGPIRISFAKPDQIDSKAYCQVPYGTYNDIYSHAPDDTARNVKQFVANALMGDVGDSNTGVDRNNPFDDAWRQAIGDSITTPAQFYLWFLASGECAKVGITQSGNIETQQSPTRMPVFSGLSKSYIFGMVRSIIMYSGIKNTVPFWSRIADQKIMDMLPVMNTIGSVSLKTPADLLSVREKTFKVGRGIGKSFPSRKDPGDIPSVANTTKSAFGVSSSGKFNDGKAAGKTGRDKRNHDSQRDDSIVDMSTNSMDKSLEDNSKGRADALNLML